MKSNIKKAKQEENKESKPEASGIRLDDEQLSEVTGGSDKKQEDFNVTDWNNMT